MSENGEGQIKGDHILLVFNKENFGLEIHGNIASLDMAMAILDQAKRELESQWRIQRGIAAQVQFKQKMEDEARVRSIMDRTIKRN